MTLLAIAGALWVVAPLAAEPIAPGLTLRAVGEPEADKPSVHETWQRLVDVSQRPERLRVPTASDDSSPSTLRLRAATTPVQSSAPGESAAGITSAPASHSPTARLPRASGAGSYPARRVSHTEPVFVAPHNISTDTIETPSPADSANTERDGTNTNKYPDTIVNTPIVNPHHVNTPNTQRVRLVAIPQPGTQMTITPMTDSSIDDSPITDAPITDAPVTDAAVTDAPSPSANTPLMPAVVQAYGAAHREPPRLRHEAMVSDAELVQFSAEDERMNAAADLEPVPSSVPIEHRGPFEIIDHSDELTVMLRRSKLLRTKVDIYRTAVVDPRVCNIVQFTPREVSVIGQAQGATHVTFWFEDGQHQPLTYLVRVVADPDVQVRREEQYQLLEEMIAELFPDSKVHLVPISNKLLVKGQARDAEEAAQIMALIRGEAVWGNQQSGNIYGGIVQGYAAPALIGQEEAPRVPAGQVINMLKIPGEQQVMLRVKIAELNRSAARKFGVDLDISISDGNLVIQSMLNAASGSSASIIGMFDGDDVNFGIHYLEQHGVVRLLSEPTLVTLSGRPATFLAGGEFAVPTTVGVGGASAVTTDFRAFGAIITFMPVVLDKDHIRLQVAPEFSQVDQELAVNGTPGLSTRSVTTTVEMREGQTLAIAGLLDDAMTANMAGDLPWISQLLGKRSVSRNETELVIMVTPELVHAMDPEEVPPLPGFDVTEPTKTEFYLEGRLEGQPTMDYRSTIWPELRRRYTHDGPAMISGPFGHGR